MQNRKALGSNLGEVNSLLEANDLPPLPRGFPLANVLVALDGETVVGAVALEVASRRGLLRSAIVAQDHRRRGVGGSLVRSAISRAHELGLRELYLLTENAAAFFTSLGFADLPRDQVPREIQATREYREQCPESARVMCLPLSTRL